MEFVESPREYRRYERTSNIYPSIVEIVLYVAGMFLVDYEARVRRQSRTRQFTKSCIATESRNATVPYRTVHRVLNTTNHT